MKPLAAVALFIFSALLLRLGYLQLYRGANYADWSRRITLRHQTLPAPRGLILDRQGTLLADNRPVFEAYLERQQIGAPDLHQWAELLDMNVNEIEEKWTEAKREPKYQPFLLKTGLSLEHMLRWKHLQSEDQLLEDSLWQGLEIRYRPTRKYVDGQAIDPFSHLLGYIKTASEADLTKNPDLTATDVIGAAGIEKKYDDRLRGTDGQAWIWVDAFGRDVFSESHHHKDPDFAPERASPIPGIPLPLTVDARLQKAAYAAFAGRPGALVALHLPDGGILSLVSSPGYDTNQFIGGIRSENWKALTDNRLRPLLNRALQGTYPPGSTYKIVTAAAALELGKIDETEKIVCPGSFTFGGHRFSCWNKRGHGAVDLRKAIEVSCDVYFYQLGLRLDVDQIFEMAKRFGLGTVTALRFPSERSGFIPSRLGLKRYYRQEWSKGYIFPIMIGQGANILTPLQAALMISRFATNNSRLEPHLLREETDTPPAAESLLSEHTHTLIKEGLKNVVYGPAGTAGRLRTLPFSLAGKTGTSQSGGTLGDHAWFVTYAPEESPEIALSVIVEHGGHGGAVAAPIAAEYLKKYFQFYHSHP